MLSTKHLMKSVRSRPTSKNLQKTFGRFAAVRNTYGHVMGVMESVGMVRGLQGIQASIFDSHCSRNAAEAVRSTGYYGPLLLPDDIVESLVNLARTGVLSHWGSGDLFNYSDVVDGVLPDCSYAVIADVVDASVHPSARRVACDPFVLEVGREVLGYSPIGVDVRILVSFRSEATQRERDAAGQTYRYHFDTHGWRFFYANYYLTDTSLDSGAHQMVDTSHKSKPIRWLFGSANRSDHEIDSAYSASDMRTIVGEAGTGFLQDSSCYHRAVEPKTSDRIMLHLRYY